MDEPPSPRLLIGIVGPCGSGKSTLIARLEPLGYTCRHIAQEHSYVQAMWQIITRPNLLIYLHASFENSTARRKLNWSESDYQEQLRRLTHARQHANLIIDTNTATPDQVLSIALDFLKKTAPQS
jgi:deoxyadenosine/deoxycytidine kinase